MSRLCEINPQKLPTTENAKWVSLRPNAKHADGVSLKIKPSKIQTNPETPRFLHSQLHRP